MHGFLVEECLYAFIPLRLQFYFCNNKTLVISHQEYQAHPVQFDQLINFVILVEPS